MKPKPQAIGLLAVLACLFAFWFKVDLQPIGWTMVAVGAVDIWLWYHPLEQTISVYTWNLAPDAVDFGIAWGSVLVTWAVFDFSTAVVAALFLTMGHLFWR
jgi:hypothetical protein